MCLRRYQRYVRVVLEKKVEVSSASNLSAINRAILFVNSDEAYFDRWYLHQRSPKYEKHIALLCIVLLFFWLADDKLHIAAKKKPGGTSYGCLWC